jgi:hypothetical protein
MYFHVINQNYLTRGAQIPLQQLDTDIKKGTL